MNKILIFVGVFIFIAILVASGHFFFTQNKKYLSRNSDTELKVLPAEDTNFIKNTETKILSYTDPKEVFTFKYTTDYTIDAQKDGKYIRLSKIGQTQKGQTELYDGVNLVFEKFDLNGKTLMQYVNAALKESEADGNVEVIETPKPFTQNGYSGFTYTTINLRSSQHIALQKDSESNFAVSITKSVEDPRNMGYKTEVDTILSTIELLK